MALLCIIGFTIISCVILVVGVIVDMQLQENAVRSDCIIVPGCKVTDVTPSLSLRSRLDCALRLYQGGYADTIIVCGALGETGSVTEARAMRNYLVNYGVPADAILLDENSFSTAQNMQNSKALMDEYGYTSAIIATSDFHTARAMACARIAGIQTVSCGKARFTWPLKWLSVAREVPGWGKCLLCAVGLMEE